MEINEDTGLKPGWNIHFRHFVGHKAVIIAFVFEDGQAKVVHSTETVSGARQWIRRNFPQ